ncbi:MAG TPA: hypothetical protein VHU18_11000 [Rhizomicrobium sp.]|jgi:hypothetical protein|nr:hypothetical protein [Rhizomicrobium sp.]
MKSGALAGVAAALLLSTALARADVEISAKATSNMSCEAGVCTATAQKAVLNVSDLATMLASGDVAVKTGLIAKDIDIDQALSWSNTSRLTLDAQASVTVKKQITVAGQGALTIVTNDSGGAKGKTKTGEFIIVPERGSVQFWDLGSSLTIDGSSYTLVGDIRTLAADIAANPSGFYALAKPYDASVDGVYSSSPVAASVTGIIQGLGNAILNLTIEFSSNQNLTIIGLIQQVETTGAIHSLGIVHADIRGVSSTGNYGPTGLLVGDNDGAIDHCWSRGAIAFPGGDGIIAGGIAGANRGTISSSFTHINTLLTGGIADAGGLVGFNLGKIIDTYSYGIIRIRSTAETNVGGLVAYNSGSVANSFSITSLKGGRSNQVVNADGVIGLNDTNGAVTSSYAAGSLILKAGDNSTNIGGFVGDDQSSGRLSASYWDLDKGVSDPKRGAGNRKNDPGVTGLTTEQLHSALPDGFNPKIWKQDMNKNQGLPYLAALPVK